MNRVIPGIHARAIHHPEAHALVRFPSCCAALLAAYALATPAVAQTIAAEPDLVVFSAVVGGPNPPPQSVALSAGSARNWRLASSFAPWLKVTPPSGSAPGSLNVSVNIAGLRAGLYQDTIGVTDDTMRIPVVLSVGDLPASPGLATYEVELSFVGYTGLVEGAPDCRVNERGYDRLVGTVSAIETQETDVDVIYTGMLRRTTAIDFCENKPGRSTDEPVWCVVTLTGSAVANVELAVYGEDGRGAWLKASPAGGPLRKNATGDCEASTIGEIRAAYPSAGDGGGGSPSGQAIDDSLATDASGRRIQFYANGHARLRVGTYPPDDPQGAGWTLRVIRKL